MEKSPLPLNEDWKRSILGGVVWLVLLFLIDAADSIVLFSKSTKRIKSSPVIQDMIAWEVLEYVFEIFCGHLLLGLLAGVLVHLFSKIWFTSPPQKKWHWWRMWFVFGAIISLTATLRNIITTPSLHGWMGVKLRNKISDSLDLWMTDGLAFIFVLSALILIWRRWNGLEKRILFNRLLLLSAWVMVVFMVVLRNPSPEMPVQNKGPNLIFIGVDALRPDRLKRNGYYRDTTPNLGRLLDESVVFNDTYSTLSRTYPSWASFMSGLWPLNSGIRENLPHPDKLAPVPMLPSVMRSAGYETYFLTDDSRFSYMTESVGFQHVSQPEVGLKSFALSNTEPRFRVFHGLLHNPLGFFISPVLRHNQAFGRSYRPELFTDHVVDTLAKASKKDRFFLAVHSCVLHAPGDRNYPWSRLFDQRGYKGKNRFRFSRSGTRKVADNMGKGEKIDTVSVQDEKIYDSGLRMADQLVGEMVKALKSSGLMENTLIVALSDHGENLWAEDLPYRYYGPNHGFHPYDDGQHHVLLSFRFPDKAHAGKEVSDTVRLIDLAPTLDEYFDLKWPREFDGKSLFPILRGEEEPEPRTVYIETGVTEKNYWPKNHRNYPFKSLSRRYAIHDNGNIYVKKEFMDAIVKAKDRVLQLGKWKLVWRPLKNNKAITELYDRSVDRLNRNDIYQKHPDIAAHLGKRLVPFLRQDGEESPLFDQWIKQSDSSPEPEW